MPNFQLFFPHPSLEYDVACYILLLESEIREKNLSLSKTVRFALSDVHRDYGDIDDNEIGIGLYYVLDAAIAIDKSLYNDEEYPKEPIELLEKLKNKYDL